MKVAVLQSNYIPWKGYFDIINSVDKFIFYEDAQYTKNDWRNRNLIKTPAGVKWLTVPVGQAINRRICDVKIKNSSWQRKHWKFICQYYSRAHFFNLYADFFRDVYLNRRWESLSELNRYLIVNICRLFLNVNTIFESSLEYIISGAKSERLLDLLRQAGATEYLSGPAAKAYLDIEAFYADGIMVKFVNYDGYPEHPQFYPPFIHKVSIVDLLFHTGPDAGNFIWGWREGKLTPQRPHQI